MFSNNLFSDFEQDSHSLSIDANGDGIADQNDVDGDGIFDDQIIDDDWSGISTDDVENISPNDFEDIEIEETLEIDDNTDFPSEIETTETVVVGDLGDAEGWHQQTYDDTCSIVAQEYILDEIGQDYGIDFSEDELRDTATDCGWYIPDGGTPTVCVGNILEGYGVGVEKSINANFEDIDSKLQAGNKVLVAIDADEIWNPNGIDDDDLIANLQGMLGQSPNHTVQVIGIDYSDSNNPMVILNDPGTPNGRGLTVSANDFLNAWEDSNNFMVATTDRNLDPDMTQFAVNNSTDMNDILLGSVSEGDYQKSWGDSYQNDADYARDWADTYASDGNVDKALEFEKKAAEAQEKASEYYQNAQEKYRSV